MIYLDKKGEGFTVKKLVTIILVLVAFIIVLFFTTNLFGGTIKKSADPYVCRTNVELAALPKKLGLSGPKDVECGVRTIVEDVAEDYEKQKKILANEMYNCWFQYGEGKIDFTTNWQGAGFSDINICYICSSIYFEKSNPLDKESLDDALKDKSTTLGKTYFEVLNKKWNFGKKETNQIVSTELDPIYVTYLIVKFHESPEDWAKQPFGVRLKSMFGLIFYRSGFEAKLLVANKEDIKELCGDNIYPEVYRYR